MNKALNSGIWYTASNFIMKSIGFITTPIFTRLLTKAEYGDFLNFQTVTMIFLYITSLNLEGSLIRASKEFKDDLDDYAVSMVALSMTSTVIWWVICSISYNYLVEIISLNRLYFNCMFLYLLFFPAVSLFQNVERFLYKYKWTVATSMSVSIGASLLSVIFVLNWNDRLMGRTIGYILPAVLIGIVITFYFFAKGRVKFNYWKYAVRITLPYTPHLLSMYLLGYIDRIMIKRYCGSEKLALYGLAYTCGMIITMLLSSVNSAYAPWLADKLSVRDYKATRKGATVMVAVFSFVAILIVLAAPEVLLIMGGKGYSEAEIVIPPVAAGCLLQYVYTFYVNIEQYEKRTVGMAVASMIAAAVNFVLNYIYILRFGYVAAAYTTYAGYLLLLLFHAGYTQKIGMGCVYENKRIIGVALVASIMIFITSELLPYALLRWAIIIVLCAIGAAIIYTKRDMVLKMVKRK